MGLWMCTTFNSKRKRSILGITVYCIQDVLGGSGDGALSLLRVPSSSSPPSSSSSSSARRFQYHSQYHRQLNFNRARIAPTASSIEVSSVQPLRRGRSAMLYTYAFQHTLSQRYFTSLVISIILKHDTCGETVPHMSQASLAA